MRTFFNDFGVLKGAYVAAMLAGCVICMSLGLAGWFA